MTNGIVSVTRGGKTVIKVVAGCDGYNADKLAGMIKDRGLSDADSIHEAAIEVGFGCEDCLVVQDADRDIFDGCDELSPRYRAKFVDPKFNPRWDRGTAEYVKIVKLEQA